MQHNDNVERNVMVFTVGGRTLALPLEDVDEVVRMVALTPVGDASPWVAGVVNVRGRPVTVVDPRPRLGAPVTPPALDHLILLVATSGGGTGVIAEGVEGVARFIEQPSGRPAGSALVAAVGRVADRLVPLVDVEGLCAVTPDDAAPRPHVEASHAAT